MTKKPLSTISFNTSDFLKSTCDSLVSDGLLQSYIYIFHHPEHDTTKPHHHVILIPCRPVDPMKIRRFFVEPVVGQPDLGCLPFTPSKIGDWLLYALHFPPYLLKKGLTRINTYNLSDFVTNEPFFFLEQTFNDSSEEFTDTRISLFIDRMRHGQDFSEILRSGLVPPNQIIFYDKLYRSNSYLLGTALDGDGNDTIPF